MSWFNALNPFASTPPPKPAKKKRPPVEVRQTKEFYDQFGHRVADIASEQGMGYGDTTGDAESRYDRQQLAGLERQIYDENGVYAAMKDNVVRNLLGADGLSLQARTGDERTNELIEKELWPEFCDNPEYSDRWKWYDIEEGCIKEILGVGDGGLVKLRNGQLQAIENERINTPTNDQCSVLTSGGKIEQGVEMTKGGKVIGYWITNPTLDGFSSAGEGRRIDKNDFIHYHGPIQRFSRTRNYPTWIQVMSLIWRLDDILDSEALAWQLLSKHAMAVNKQDADLDSKDLSTPDTNDNADDGSVSDRVTEHKGGLFFWGEPGETISGIDRNLPGKDFPTSVRTFLQLFAMRIGLPLEILMLDWSKTNFSSGKASLNQATNMIRRFQMNGLMRQVSAPVYLWKVRHWIAQGRLKETDTIFNHEWFPPALPWIDPKEDALAWGVQIDRGLVTYSAALKHQGKDIKTENEEREKDIRAAIERSQKIEEETGVAVSWKIFAGYIEGKTESAFSKRDEGNADEGADEDKPEDDGEKEEPDTEKPEDEDSDDDKEEMEYINGAVYEDESGRVFRCENGQLVLINE